MSAHKWKNVISVCPGEPTEHFTVCDECGIELDEENENAECVDPLDEPLARGTT